MGQSSHPRANSPVFKIEARPEEHEALIERQGQWARIISTKKCPCITAGKPVLSCTLCYGKGYACMEKFRVSC